MVAPVTITSIEVAGPDRRARRLMFSDGLERKTAATVVTALDLEPGSAIDRVALEEALLTEEPLHARERALRWVGYRERSPEELRVRLTRDGFPDDVSRAVVQRFEELGLVDEARFAEMWVRSRVRAGYGRRRIATELSTRGVSEHVAAAALGLSEGTDVERARNQLARASLRSPKDRDRAMRRLVARGFDFGTARDAIASTRQLNDTGDDALDE